MNRSEIIKFWFVQSLTLGRLPLILFFLIITLATDTQRHPLWFTLAFGAMILSALTDLFDGYYARKFNMVTRLGAHADPLIDKMFYLITFPALVYLAGVRGEFGHAKLLVALTVLFLLRDQWVSFLRSIGAMHQVDAKANWSGKARTIISFPVICIIYYYFQTPFQSPGLWWLRFPFWFVVLCESVSLAINVISIWVYTAYYWPYLRKEMRLPRDNRNAEDQ